MAFYALQIITTWGGPDVAYVGEPTDGRPRLVPNIRKAKQFKTSRAALAFWEQTIKPVMGEQRSVEIVCIEKPIEMLCRNCGTAARIGITDRRCPKCGSRGIFWKVPEPRRREPEEVA